MGRQSRGSAVPIGSNSEALRQRVTSLGDANVQKGGLTLGRVEGGNTVGQMDAEYVRLKLTTGVADYIVGHARGRVPGLVERVEHVSPGGAVYVVNPLNKEKWTFSTVQVRVTAVAGGAITTGDAILLRIGGSQAGG